MITTVWTPPNAVDSVEGTDCDADHCRLCTAWRRTKYKLWCGFSRCHARMLAVRTLGIDCFRPTELLFSFDLGGTCRCIWV